MKGKAYEDPWGTKVCRLSNTYTEKRTTPIEAYTNERILPGKIIANMPKKSKTNVAAHNDPPITEILIQNMKKKNKFKTKEILSAKPVKSHLVWKAKIVNARQTPAVRPTAISTS